MQKRILIEQSNILKLILINQADWIKRMKLKYEWVISDLTHNIFKTNNPYMWMCLPKNYWNLELLLNFIVYTLFSN